MFVKISVLIESGDWVLRTGPSGAGAGGEHLHPDFSLSVSAARKRRGGYTSHGQANPPNGYPREF